jgi:hypothetical protein
VDPEVEAYVEKGLALVREVLATDTDAFLGGKDDDRFFDVVLPLKEWIITEMGMRSCRLIMLKPDWEEFTARFKDDLLRLCEGREREEAQAQWDAARARRDKK